MVIKIEIYELLKAFSMQKKCFKPIYEKYYDETSPCKQSFAKFVSRTTKSSFQMYWIIDNSTKVGQIWIATKNDTAKLARLFVLPKYQYKGYATKAIIDIEKLYSYYNHWQLDTIKEEKKNVHLYQKLGYKPNGKEKIINDKMTITEFEKEINDERSNWIL